jgi:hypothetical protein
VIAAIAEGDWLRQELVFAVGHHEVGIAGEFGEAGGQAWNGADAGGQDFAVVAPGFGGSGNCQLGEAVGCVRHVQ